MSKTHWAPTVSEDKTQTRLDVQEVARYTMWSVVYMRLSEITDKVYRHPILFAFEHSP